MILSFINRIKKAFKKLHDDAMLNELIKLFQDEDWDKVTSVVLLNFYAAGEKQYKALNSFIDEHEPTEDLHELLDNYCKGNYKELLLRCKKLTPAQEKLLSTCLNRKLNTSIIQYLEAIKEYENHDYNLSSIGDNNTDC